MTKIVLIYLVVVNVIAFTLFGIDKRKAIKNEWRIKEATLLGVAAVGGSIGGIIGMRIFHHKTQKPKFKFGMPAIICLQIIVAFLIEWKR